MSPLDLRLRPLVLGSLCQISHSPVRFQSVVIICRAQRADRRAGDGPCFHAKRDSKPATRLISNDNINSFLWLASTKAYTVCPYLIFPIADTLACDWN